MITNINLRFGESFIVVTDPAEFVLDNLHLAGETAPPPLGDPPGPPAPAPDTVPPPSGNSQSLLHVPGWSGEWARFPDPKRPDFPVDKLQDAEPDYIAFSADLSIDRSLLNREHHYCVAWIYLSGKRDGKKLKPWENTVFYALLVPMRHGWAIRFRSGLPSDHGGPRKDVAIGAAHTRHFEAQVTGKVGGDDANDGTIVHDGFSIVVPRPPLPAGAKLNLMLGNGKAAKVDNPWPLRAVMYRNIRLEAFPKGTP